MQTAHQALYVSLGSLQLMYLTKAKWLCVALGEQKYLLYFGKTIDYIKLNVS